MSEVRVRQRLEAIGVPLSDAQWGALPQAARRRLCVHPDETLMERRSLAALVGWLATTFPPGWNEDS